MSPRFYHSVPQLSKPPTVSEDAWDLFCAAAVGHLPTMRRCIDQDPELQHQQIQYEFPLHFAVRGGHAEAVKLLLDAGTNPAWSYFRYSSWQKLLPIAQQRGHDEIHALLISEMRQRFNYDPAYQPLFKAIGEDADIDTMSRIIAKEPSLVHAGDEHGNRAIHWAVLARRIPMIEKLLEAGADIHARRADQQTPLHLAMLGGDYWFEASDNPEPDVRSNAIVDYLLENGATYEFSLAVQRGDRKRMQEILDNDPSAATRLNESRRSPLGIAADAGRMDIVKMLLDLGADPNQPEECCPRGNALINACWRQDVAMATLLLKHGADPLGYSDSSGDCFSAAEHRESERTEELLQLLTDFNGRQAAWKYKDTEAVRNWMRDDKGIAASPKVMGGLWGRIINLEDVDLLDEFVKRYGNAMIQNLDPAKGWNVVGDAKFLDALIRHGMNINRPDWHGRTHLHWCAGDKESTHRAKLYLDRGVEINTVDFMTNTTALGVAAMKGNLDMVKYLLERGAQPQIPTDQECTQPKNLADREGHWKVERFIRTHIVLDQFANDPAELLESDPAILHRSAHYSEEQIVLAALNAGADIEAEHPAKGGKPLHWATEGNAKICKWLVDRGAQVNSRVESDNERNGMTPLIYCAWWCGDDDECIRIADYLIDAGADVTARDAEGKSAVERAIQRGHDNLAAALKKRGCA